MAGAAARVTAGPPVVVIELRALFSLAAQPGVPRWNPSLPKPGEPVPQATVAVRGSTISVLTNANGQARLPRAGLGSGTVLDVSPPSSQASRSAAGPATSTANFATEPRFRFRPFQVTASFNATGFDASVAPTVSLATVAGVPPHALVFRLDTHSREHVLTIDWKPDWIKSANRHAMTPKVNDVLVLHQTGVTEDIGSHINTFTNATNVVGIHYLVDVDGHVVKLVDEHDRVNHTGPSFWAGNTQINAQSIGIETVHSDGPPAGLHDFPAAQYDSIVRLVREIRAAFPSIARQHVVGHSDVETVGGGDSTIGTNRQDDPGPAFEWERLESAGQARHDITTVPPPTIYGLSAGQFIDASTPVTPQVRAHILEIQAHLSAIGYSIAPNGVARSGVYDVALQRAVTRFQRRYFSGARRALQVAPFRLGRVDYTTAAMIVAVLADTGP